MISAQALRICREGKTAWHFRIVLYQGAPRHSISLTWLIFGVIRSRRVLFERFVCAAMLAGESLPREGEEQPIGSVNLAGCCIGHLRGRSCLGSVVAKDHAHWRGPC